MPNCLLEYDLLANWYDWWFLAAGILGGLISVAILYFVPMGLKKSSPAARRRLVTLSLALMAIWILGTFLTTYLPYRRLRTDYVAGRYSEVAGEIQNFVAEDPKLAGSKDSFTVEGKSFSYSQNVITSGYRKTRAEGSPLRDGLHVKIRYIGNTIVRLEIC